ncbi:uncharacterized protein [Ptychodera flava]|uniref:uncharacterized protein n=1 Tax=Ptychodera flava TaxID=63121 RepID=UPI003969D2F5
MQSKEDTSKLVQSERRVRCPRSFSESFLDPFELSIDISEPEVNSSDSDDDDDDDDDDEDYEPSFDMSILIDGVEFFPALSDDEVVEDGGTYDDDEEIEDDIDDIQLPGLRRVLTEEDGARLLDDRTCLVFLEQLIILGKQSIRRICAVKSCNGEISPTSSFVGSALYLKWGMDEWIHQGSVPNTVHTQ